MSEKYIIGIDEGSQSAKILIFDTKGNIVCEGKHPLKPYNLPGPELVEHPDDRGNRTLYDPLLQSLSEGRRNACTAGS